MHILFLTHYFPPEVNAPASRTFENARRWVSLGNKVTVITCAPNHPNGIVYPGYKNRIWQWDEISGIRVLRVMTYLSANKGFMRRIFNYISYMTSATFFCGLVSEVDIVVSTSPQFFCGMAGYFVSRIKRQPWVLEIRDLWPESIIAVGAIKQRGIIRLLERIERFFYSHADHVVSLTRSFEDHILKRGGKPERISLVRNGADLEMFHPMKKDNPVAQANGLSEKFVVSYIGTHGMAHGLETVLKAAYLLVSEKDILFLLVGDGAERENLLKQKNAFGLKNVILLPQQPRDKIPGLLAGSDACMVLLRDNDLFKTVIPSKIFEAMAMERPLILGVDGECREIIQEANCGIPIRPENHEDLAGAVKTLYLDRQLSQSLGCNGRRFVEKDFDRQILAEKYLGILQGVLGV